MAELLFSHCGATLGNIKVTDLDFADDVAILSESVRASSKYIEVRESFTYLSSVIHNSGLLDQDQATRLQGPDNASFTIW